VTLTDGKTLLFIGLTGTTLAFIMPPLFYLKLMWQRTKTVKKLLLIAILVFGISATLITTGVNIDAIVTDDRNSTVITC